MTNPFGLGAKLAIYLATIFLTPAALAQSPSLDEANEAAVKAAVAKVAPSVVVIETTGGTERVGATADRRGVRKGVGPTTGLIVAADGYVISSSFNFANKPTAITISVPGKPDRFVGKIIAHDHSRMVTLLKIDATELPVPEIVPQKEIKVGLWAIAVGRALNPNPESEPAVSVGVISALNRIWGKMMQADAKVSPVNYGGPLIGIDGRVFGLLVPAAPGAEGESAGFEWYDSGIGFAVPMEHIMSMLPRLREGKDLRRGLLGFTPKGTDDYSVPPAIATVTPESTAAKAGMKPGDVIVAVDGQPVANRAQVMHLLGPRYEGDKISLKIKRGKEEVSLDNLVLMGAVPMYSHPFVGFLPMRDDPELGVAVRYVYPDSPAAKAGLKAGDRILKFGTAAARQLIAFSGRDQFREMLDLIPAGTDVKLDVRRADGKSETLTLKTVPLPDTVPADATLDSTVRLALAPRKQVPVERPEGILKGKGKDKEKEKEKEEPKEEPKTEEEKKEPVKAETGLIQRPSPSRDREYWLYVPANYDPNVSHGVVIWLHAPGMGGKEAKDLSEIWRKACEEHHLILVGPKSNNETGWLASEAEFIQETVREVTSQYTIDRQRIAAHGMSVGGQMAYYLAFNARDLIRGAAVSGATLNNPPKENVAGQRLSLFIVAGGKDPLIKEIAAAKPLLEEKRLPVIYREVAEMGKEYLDRKTFDELVRWVDSLDRL